MNTDQQMGLPLLLPEEQNLTTDPTGPTQFPNPSTVLQNIVKQKALDTVGRKMIFPSAGYDGDADFVRLLYTSSIDGMGVNQELYWDKLDGSEASKNLKGFSCSNAREYIGQSMRG